MQRMDTRQEVRLALSPGELDLSVTLDCGQCFRFQSPAPGEWEGIAGNRWIRLIQTPEEIRLCGVSREDYESFWRRYLGLDTDYGVFCRRMAEEPALREALAYAPGIRILRQDPFEALVSFIISQNSNIPRIRACIERLCRTFGEEIGEGRYAFPTPEALARAELSAYAPLALGYRDTYVLSCARAVAEGRVDLAGIERMPLDQARAALQTLHGVGPKVAECALLFGFGQMGAFPVDTWMKKALLRFYPAGFPEALADIAGIAQQYLFHYIRTCREAVPAGQGR